MRKFLNRWSASLFALTLMVMLLNGCLTSKGGCKMDDSLDAKVQAQAVAQALEQLAQPAKYEKFDLPGLRDYGMVDREHDCVYVVLSGTVFCWRGTNLISYTRE